MTKLDSFELQVFGSHWQKDVIAMKLPWAEQSDKDKTTSSPLPTPQYAADNTTDNNECEKWNCTGLYFFARSFKLKQL